jgi:hypothetical protein
MQRRLAERLDPRRHEADAVDADAAGTVPSTQPRCDGRPPPARGCASAPITRADEPYSDAREIGNAFALSRFALVIDSSSWPEESEDMPRWPENPDDPVDPAIAPLIEAGEGEAEGFDVAEADLIRHAEHGDQEGTDPIWRDAAGFPAQEIPGLDDDRYGAADDEDPET